MMPRMEAVARVAKKHGINVLVAKLDADANHFISDKYNIKGFPRVKLFNKQEFVDYEYTKEPTATEIFNWVRSKVGVGKNGRDILYIASPKDFDDELAARRFLAFGLFKNATDAAGTNFEAVTLAKHLLKPPPGVVVSFCESSEQALFDKFDVKSDDAVFLMREVPVDKYLGKKEFMRYDYDPAKNPNDPFGAVHIAEFINADLANKAGGGGAGSSDATGAPAPHSPHSTSVSSQPTHAGKQRAKAHDCSQSSRAKADPVYSYVRSTDTEDHFYTMDADEVGSVVREGTTGKHNFNFLGSLGFMFKEHMPCTVPMYRYWSPTQPRLYTQYQKETAGTDYSSEGILGYLFSHKVWHSLKPVFRYTNGPDRIYVMAPLSNMSRVSGWGPLAKTNITMEGIAGWIFPH
jgi:hypothetical protein